MTKYLLIDDDYIFNLIHRRIINLADPDGEILVYSDSVQALEYIKTLLDSATLLPEFVFLDISMPVINGFELLDGLSHYPREMFSSTKLYIVTSSLNDKDMKKAFSYDIVTGYQGKPLTKEIIEEIIS
jgi:CheY-like chemotaxis protein